jgi:mono/diheme cytochrome c family protein
MRHTWAIRVMFGTSLLAAVGLFLLPAKSEDKSAATYKQKCVACHGADGKGETPTGKTLAVPSFSSPEVNKMSDQELADAIEKGKGKMPKYGASMKPEEIKAMVAYIRTMGK